MYDIKYVINVVINTFDILVFVCVNTIYVQY